MDLLPELDLMSPAIQAEVVVQRQRHNAEQQALFAADNNHVVNKLSMMRLLGFTSKHIEIFFHFLQI